MKKLLIIIFILFMPINCSADENTVAEQFELVGGNEIFDISSEVFPNFDSKKIVEDLSNGSGFKTEKIIDLVASFFMQEFKDNLRICALILAMGFVIGVLTNMQSAYGGKGVSEAGFLVGYAVFAGLLAGSFSEIIMPAKEMIEAVSVMVKSTIAILLTMLTFGGGTVTSGLMAPVMISLVNVLNSVIADFIFPLILCSFALSICSNMSEKINISQMVLTSRKCIKWILLFIMAIFAGVFGIYGLSGSAIDASAGKAVRFAIGSGIPIVGGVAADSLETVIATLGATRNIIGTVGMCAIVVLAAAPIIKTAVLMWIFRLCCVIIEPFSSPRIVKLLSDTAESISLIFSVLISVCLLLIGALGILLIAGNFIVR